MIFVNIDLLLIVIWQSIKEKTFKCDLFENIFYDYSDLDNHIRVHAGRWKKQYKCIVCDKVLSKHSIFAKQKIIQSGINQFVEFVKKDLLLGLTWTNIYDSLWLFCQYTSLS